MTTRLSTISGQAPTSGTPVYVSQPGAQYLGSTATCGACPAPSHAALGLKQETSKGHVCDLFPRLRSLPACRPVVTPWLCWYFQRCSPLLLLTDGRMACADRHRRGELDAHRHAGISQLQPDTSHGRPDGTACVLQNRKVRLSRSVVLHGFRLLWFEVVC